MEEEIKEEILGNISLFLKGIRSTVQSIETSELTFQAISKKHLRILHALSPKYARISEYSTYTLQEVKAMIAKDFNKQYPLGDIRSFLFDLIRRHCVMFGHDDEENEVFRIQEKGKVILTYIKESFPELLKASSTPNFYEGIRH